MNIDLSTHSAAINDAISKVRDGKGIDWVILSLDSKTNTLVVGGTGNGIEELEEEFNDGKIEFGYCRVVDENSQLPKTVFISWCGEGVPENKKGFLQIHTTAVEKLVKGYHVHISARSEKDVDKATIMKKVRDSSGANYSFHKETAKPQGNFAPVGSNYQKPEIIGRSNPPPVASKSNANDVAEKRRQQEQEERQRAQEEQERQQRKEREEDQQRRAQEDQERRQREDQQRQEQQRQDQQRQEQQRQNQQRQDQERQQREEQERREREDQQRRAQEDQERRQREEQERHQREEQERHQREEQERLQREEENLRAQAQAQAQASQTGASSGGLSATVLYDYEAGESNELSLHAGDTISNIEMIDEGWWQGYDSQGNFGMFPSTYVQMNEGGEATPAPQAQVETQAEETGKQSATALYSYDAGDEGEISFAENEIISDINFIDDNWWQGYNSQGQYGMFPANYVQLNQ